ncbi:hypothetical protein [Tabrizicola sp.]|uniref:hypothetical protein n=1 Tax=Tabrizicola sp. TaxID=2005166 RepID=UPI003F3C03FF
MVSANGWLPSASVHVGAPTEATVFATVRIEPSDQQHYLVLESWRQIIWNIEGDTDSVSRVIVLGATSLGPWAAGVIGIPEDRVFFTDPDLSALDVVQQTSCTRMAYSCTASQWFGSGPSDQVTFHPEPEQGRLEADAFVEPSAFSFEPLPGQESTPAWPVGVVTPEYSDQPVSVDPTSVVSLRAAETYDQPTGQAGLNALVASGALLAPGDPGFAEAVNAYAEAFSARYRTRFTPDFLFVPQVDYVVTRAFRLPADSPSSTYLLGAGAPLPEMNGNDDYRTCFLELDRAGEPAGPESLEGPYCRDQSLGMPEPDGELFLSAQRADNVERGVDCRQMELPDGAEIVVVNVTENGPQRYSGKSSREIAVEVAGDGPLVLYLHNTGGPVRWALSGRGISQVFFLRGPEFQDPVTLNGGAVAQAKLGVDREGCPWFPPYHLNAPGYLHLDEMMKTLLGQAIDRLIEVQLDEADPARIVVD